MALTLPASAITLFQPDTFNSGVEGWVHGITHPARPVTVADQGPAGIGDTALRITSAIGGGPGSRLAAFNVESKWTGDYVSAGVIALALDLRNIGDTSLHVRIAVNGPTGWAATDALLLAGGGDWTSHVFDLSPAALNSLSASDPASVLSDVDEIRILHNSQPAFQGGSVNGALLVDNVTAVPESSALILGAFSVTILLRRKR